MMTKALSKHEPGARLSSDMLMRHHQLNEHEREVAELCADRIMEYRAWHKKHLGQSIEYTGEIASETANKQMPRASDRRRCHVLTTAIAMAWERGARITQKKSGEPGNKRALPIEDRDEVWRLYHEEDYTYRELQEKYGVASSTIWRIIKGEAA